MGTHLSYFRAIFNDLRQREEQIKAEGAPPSDFARSVRYPKPVLVMKNSKNKPV